MEKMTRNLREIYVKFTRKLFEHDAKMMQK